MFEFSTRKVEKSTKWRLRGSHTIIESIRSSGSTTAFQKYINCLPCKVSDGSGEDPEDFTMSLKEPSVNRKQISTSRSTKNWVYTSLSSANRLLCCSFCELSSKVTGQLIDRVSRRNYPQNCILNFVFFSVLNWIKFGLSSCINRSINPHVCLCVGIVAFHKILNTVKSFRKHLSQAELSMQYHEIEPGGGWGAPVSNFLCKCIIIPFILQKST